MTEAPRELVVGGDRPSVYRQRLDLCAVRNHEGADGVAVVTGSASERFVVYQRGAQGVDADSCFPVYSAGQDGPLAVATGRVFVRLDAGQDARAYDDRFGSAGFEIERVLSYASHAAWLRANDGDIAAALSSLPMLARLPGVANVEPQLLLERANK